jgi:hypothetical protein
MSGPDNSCRSLDQRPRSATPLIPTKGRKDRNAIISPQLLELLRFWWREVKRRSVCYRMASCSQGAAIPTRSRPGRSTAPSTRRLRRGIAPSSWEDLRLRLGGAKPARTSTFDGIPRRASALTRTLPSTVMRYGASRLTRRTMLGGSCSIPHRRLRTRRTAPLWSVSSRRDTSRCAGTCIRGGRAWRSCSRPGCARWCMDTRGTSRRCHDPRWIDMAL